MDQINKRSSHPVAWGIAFGLTFAATAAIVAPLASTAAKEAAAKEAVAKETPADKPAGAGAGASRTDAAPSGADLPGSPAKPLATQDLSLDQAHRILMAARKKAMAVDTKMDIAIVDAGGNLKAFARMDGAWLGSIDIAIKKAKTARYFDMPTGEIGKLSQPGKPLYQIEASNGGLITFPGGVPLKAADGAVIGAIGVSGSSVENDHAVAEAGAAALK